MNTYLTIHGISVAFVAFAFLLEKDTNKKETQRNTAGTYIAALVFAPIVVAFALVLVVGGILYYPIVLVSRLLGMPYQWHLKAKQKERLEVC